MSYILSSTKAFWQIGLCLIKWLVTVVLSSKALNKKSSYALQFVLDQSIFINWTFPHFMTMMIIALVVLSSKDLNKNSCNALHSVINQSIFVNKFILFFELCTQLKPIKDNVVYSSHMWLYQKSQLGLETLGGMSLFQNSENFLHPPRLKPRAIV